ncbi:MAG: arginase family protein [Candidatus Aenigmatarchaeota archaeon]
MLYTSPTFVPYNYPQKEADVLFVGIPFSSTSTSLPSSYGPTVVREALKLTESRLGRIKISDIGDLEAVPGSFELTAQRIKDTIEEVALELEPGRPFPFLVAVGGNHSITLPLCEALKPKTIVVLDAHADCRHDYLGNPHTHQTWAWHASKFANVVNVGLNAPSAEEEAELAANKNLVSLSPEAFLEIGPNLEQPIHLSVDIDVFDPAYVVTGLPEGRLKPEQVWPMLERLAPHIASMDIVEIAEMQLAGKTAFLAARIIKTVLERKFLRF